MAKHCHVDNLAHIGGEKDVHALFTQNCTGIFSPRSATSVTREEDATGPAHSLRGGTQRRASCRAASRVVPAGPRNQASRHVPDNREVERKKTAQRRARPSEGRTARGSGPKQAHGGRPSQ
eukprot:6185297-Amphidinium_carterae.1